MKAAALRADAGAGSDEIELVCRSGHRTTHALARVLRLNDSWCGKCGADIRYTPPAPAGVTSEGQDNHLPPAGAEAGSKT